MGSAAAPALLAPKAPASDIVRVLTWAPSCSNCCFYRWEPLCVLLSESEPMRALHWTRPANQVARLSTLLSLYGRDSRINTELFRVSTSSLHPEQRVDRDSNQRPKAHTLNQSSDTIFCQGKAKFPLVAHGLSLLKGKC